MGAVVGPGFRAKATAAAPGEGDAGTLLNLLLDDLPGAALVSGYALAPRRHRAPQAGRRRVPRRPGRPVRGLGSEAPMIAIIREHGHNPTPIGPPAPARSRDDDPIAFHALPPLPPHSMRRLRRIDVMRARRRGDARHGRRVLPRQPRRRRRGLETVVHEYSVAARVDRATLTIVDIDARADVLPWKECPGASAARPRLVGTAARRPAGVRARDVRRHDDVHPPQRRAARPRRRRDAAARPHCTGSPRCLSERSPAPTR